MSQSMTNDVPIEPRKKYLNKDLKKKLVQILPKINTSKVDPYAPETPKFSKSPRMES